jgi:putative ABC transport system ATP-binding protein/lipoprotein-releasing system ATP-binding protein
LPQIEVRDVSKIYKVEDLKINAVDAVSFNIEKGEYISIIGHSGSGKSTLLSMIGGVLRMSSGRIHFNGTDIYGLEEDGLSEYRAEKIGYIFQFATLLPVLTVRENLLLATIFKTARPNNIEKKIEDLLWMVGLRYKINAYPSQLSGGQQRRVAIARALINDPEVILADEPTGDLDEHTEKETMELLKRINRDQGITFILVTHNLSLARNAKRWLKMSNGRLHEI